MTSFPMACRKKVATTHSTLIMKYRKTDCEEEKGKLITPQYIKVINISIQMDRHFNEMNVSERSKKKKPS